MKVEYAPFTGLMLWFQPHEIVPMLKHLKLAKALAPEGDQASDGPDVPSEVESALLERAGESLTPNLDDPPF